MPELKESHMLMRVKNYIRCIMKEEWLNGIMIANVNQDVIVDEKIIFNEFVDASCRRLNFVKFDVPDVNPGYVHPNKKNLLNSSSNTS